MGNKRIGLDFRKPVLYNSGARWVISGGKWCKDGWPLKTTEKKEERALAGMIGRYEHSMDAKGRIFLPAKHRESLTDKVYLTVGFEQCLTLFSEEEWNVFEESIYELPFPQSDEAERIFIGNASVLDVDAQGRIAIPQNLRSHAQLEKEVTFVGLGRRAEIWNTNILNEANSQIDMQGLKQSLREAGFRYGKKSGV